MSLNGHTDLSTGSVYGDTIKVDSSCLNGYTHTMTTGGYQHMAEKKEMGRPPKVIRGINDTFENILKAVVKPVKQTQQVKVKRTK